MKKVIIGMTLLFMVSAVSAGSSRLKKINERIEINRAEKIVIDVDLGAGEFKIKSDDIEEVALIEIEYDSKDVEALVFYEEKGTVGYLEIESNQLRNTHMYSDDNLWDITLSNRYPVDLHIEMGACDLDIDLGGIPLKELDLDIGAASGVINFSKPNPIRLREIRIDAGVSAIEIENLGNANFEKLQFSGGIGSFEIDLRGEFEGESFLEFEIGLGSAEIIVPKGVGVQIEVRGGNWLSSIDFHNVDLDEVEDDLFETEDFEDQDRKMYIKLDIGIGSVDLYWKK